MLIGTSGESNSTWQPIAAFQSTHSICVGGSWRFSFVARSAEGSQMKRQAMPGWLKVKEAAVYCGLSERTVRSLLKEGLRYSRLQSGTILIKHEWLDEFFEGFEVRENEVDTIVKGVMRDFSNSSCV